MAETVTMPQLGESVVEGTIARWLKQPGDRVARYEMIVSVVTDKVDTEIPSPAEGVMGELIVPEGTVVAVGEPICTIETEVAVGAPAIPPPPEAEEASPPPPPAADAWTYPPPPAGQQPEPGPAHPPPSDEVHPFEEALTAHPQDGEAMPEAPTPAPGDAGVPAPAPTAPTPPAANAEPAGRLHLTPAVRALAREHGVDLSAITGTGVGGRITKRDVLEHVEQRDRAPAAAAPGAPVVGGDTVVPLTPIRRAIADHMVRSRRTSPHAWMMMEVDMSAVVRLRSAHREDFRRRHGTSLTFLPFVARAVVDALGRFPTLNATWSDEGIVLRRDINLGIAIALEDNLIVPVIRSADRLSTTGLATSMADLAERARTKRLTPDETQGGTFTLNNTGSLGTILSQPIINQPQAAILAMDAIVRRPVVVSGPDGVDAIGIRSMMHLCISFDHRINDGLSATRFLRAVKEMLEGTDPVSGLA